MMKFKWFQLTVEFPTFSWPKKGTEIFYQFSVPQQAESGHLSIITGHHVTTDWNRTKSHCTETKIRIYSLGSTMALMIPHLRNWITNKDLLFPLSRLSRFHTCMRHPGADTQPESCSKMWLRSNVWLFLCQESTYFQEMIFKALCYVVLNPGS